MNVQSLVPTNSKLAADVAVKAFLKFLEAESVSKDSINVSTLADPSCNEKVAVGAVQLTEGSCEREASQDGANVGQVLLEERPRRGCEEGTSVHKSDLHLLMSYFYKHATSGADYSDAAMVCSMWFSFGRASDLSMMQKQSLSVSANNVLFLRLVRVKISEEQGLSLYPDHDNFVTYPTHAIALLMQASPCAPLLDQIPRQPERIELFVGVHVSLLEMLSNGAAAEEIGINSESGPKKPVSSREPGIHSYVSRI